MKAKIQIILILFVVSLMACNTSKKPQQISEEEKTSYIDKGRLISSASFGALSSNLKSVLVSQGISEAIEFCSLKAYPLTDSLSEEYNVIIKRTSNFIRNPENKPNDEENEMLNFFTRKSDKGEDLKPEVIRLSDGTVVYYAPIMINTPVCLNCHGKLVENVLVENHQKIKEIYPDDKAIGYELNDFRGMWSIRFK